MSTTPPALHAESPTATADDGSALAQDTSTTLAPVKRCDMNGPPLSLIERALVGALVSAIVKELQGERPPAETASS